MTDKVPIRITTPPHAQKTVYMVNPTYVELDMGDCGAYAGYSGHPSVEDFKKRLHERVAQKWPNLMRSGDTYFANFSVVSANADIWIVVSPMRDKDISISLIPLQGSLSQRDALEFSLIVRSEWPEYHLEETNKPGVYSREVAS